MGPLPDDVQRVKQATDIVDVVGASVPLQRAGSSWRALCPFHEERTPSFHVFPQSQVFRCFGCNVAGDVLTFVERHQKVTFREALQWLADRAGIALARGPRDVEGAPRKTVYALLEATCAYFEGLLRRAPAGLREALEKRGLTPEVCAEWRIGLAPSGWQRLHGVLTEEGFPLEAQIAAGVVKRAESGCVHDRFRDRVTFPITDVLGRVVAFGARLLPGVEESPENGPKYLNSPEGELFQKRSILYGLDKIAKRTGEGAGAEGPPVAVMEGYTDVILAHRAGMRRAVATLGTALGRDHAKLLRRYSPRVLLLYDGDEAGLRASERGVGVLLEEGLEVRVAVLPHGLDPADFVLAHGADAFLRQVGDGVDFLEFLAQRLQLRPGTGNATQESARACDEVLRHLVKVESAVQRELWVRKVALWFSLPESRVNERLHRLVDSQAGAPARRGSGAGAPPHEGDASSRRDRRAAEELLGGCLRDPSLLALVRARGFDPADLGDERLRAVLRAALACAAEGYEADVHAVTARLGDVPWRDLPAALLTSSPRNAEEAVEKSLRYFESLRASSRIASLRSAIRDAARAGDALEEKRLQGELLAALRSYRGIVGGGHVAAEGSRGA